jgi:hypothetical protein
MARRKEGEGEKMRGILHIDDVLFHTGRDQDESTITNVLNNIYLVGDPNNLNILRGQQMTFHVTASPLSDTPRRAIVWPEPLPGLDFITYRKSSPLDVPMTRADLDGFDVHESGWIITFRYHPLH